MEKAGEADPLNPNISGDIAQLLPLKIKPSKKLLDILKQQIEAGITSVSAHILLAEGYFAFGNMKEAMRNWEFALVKDPNNITVLNNLALVLAKTSDANVERSLNMLNKALSLSPGNAEILDSLGDVLFNADRFKESINKYELSLKNDPKRHRNQKKNAESIRSERDGRYGNYSEASDSANREGRGESEIERKKRFKLTSITT